MSKQTYLIVMMSLSAIQIAALSFSMYMFWISDLYTRCGSLRGSDFDKEFARINRINPVKWFGG